MADLTGRTLSHFRLEARIGAGGMGEVYRGMDTRLDRTVAVKILPSDLHLDDDRKRRFTQEARTASALNHPNIVTLHDVGSEAGIDFIVMEIVEGKTLEEVIGRRPMAIGPLLRYATQIADALTAAHAAGIVHRDLKPTNIMVTDQGLVKVLDFGLAKLAEASAPTADEHTRTSPHAGSPTERGTIVGTASYMSPEQAEGGVVDARSDIFSFGSVLYEMASGRRAFEGTTTMSTIAAVLRDEPPRVSTITAPLPHDLEVLINRCLKKDPGRRVQHMADLKVALQELKEDSDSGRLMMSIPPVTAARRRPIWAIAAAALALVVAVAGLTGWFMSRRSATAPSPAALRRLTFDTGQTITPALSPDGKLVVYASDRATPEPNLWLQQVDGDQAAVQLTHHAGGAITPAFSPDGTRIAYSGAGKDEGVYVVPTIGGEPRKIAPKGFGPKFSPDGSQLAYSATEGFQQWLMLVSAVGGPSTKVSETFNGLAPLWSPDGSHLLASGRVDPKGSPLETVDWFVISVKDGTAVRTGAATALRSQKVIPSTTVVPVPSDWTEGGVLFSVATADGAEVWRLSLSPSTFQTQGAAEQLTFGTARESDPTTSRDGKMAFAAVDIIADYWTLPLDANAAKVTGPRAQIMSNSASENAALSLDGSTMFYCSHRNNQSEIRSRNFRSGKETTLVTMPGAMHIVSSTADGGQFTYNIPGVPGKRFLASASGEPAREICQDCMHSGTARDASKLLYIVEPDHHTYRLLDVRSGTSSDFITSPTLSFGSAAFSPDGHWAAVTTSAGHLFLVPVRDSRVDEKDWITLGQISAPEGHKWPSFSPDGNTVYYVSNEDGHACIYARRLSANRQPSGDPVVVQHLHEANAYGHPHDMAVGADKIVLLMNQGSSNIWLMQPRR